MLDNSIDFKEQMIEARRTQILMGAAQVFAKKGFHRATTKEIARQAGVAEGTIYNYFDNKRDLLLAMVEMLATRSIKANILEHPPDDPKEFFSLLLHDRYQLLKEYGHIMAPMIAEIFSDPDLREAIYRSILMPVAEPIEQYIQHRIDSGEFKPVNPIVITRALIGSIGLNTAFQLSGVDARYETISVEAMVEQIVEMFLAVTKK
ncbi:MAG: TetR/AcrR family transcriptional regulator [Anaerolineaceae bacterium]|nr:TetR/AcrR family transcriptional regulator [Anaerolineaceae bacterium]